MRGDCKFSQVQRLIHPVRIGISWRGYIEMSVFLESCFLGLQAGCI